jgi:hypothetical protein
VGKERLPGASAAGRDHGPPEGMPQVVLVLVARGRVTEFRLAP